MVKLSSSCVVCLVVRPNIVRLNEQNRGDLATLVCSQIPSVNGVLMITAPGSLVIFDREDAASAGALHAKPASAESVIAVAHPRKSVVRMTSSATCASSYAPSAITCRPMSATRLVPVSAMLTSSSRRMMSIALATPASPAAPSP